MVPELEKSRVIEIQVRMDCNGCVQKIKKALHGINGIYDLYIDFPQQKLIVIGWADPEKIIKAIRKTRKVIGSVCIHTEPAEQAPEGTEPPPEGGAPPPDTTVPPTNTDSPPQTTESTNPQAEPPKDPPPPENQVLEFHPTSVAIDATASFHLGHHSGTRDIVEQIHVIHHHQHEYNGHLNNLPPPLDGHMNSRNPPVDNHLNSHPPPPPVDGHHGYWSNSTKSHSGFIRPEPPAYVSHSYNTHKPSPYRSEYEYVRSPPRQTHYSTRTEHYYSSTEDYQVRDNSSSSSGNNITSIFSDENPNACRIV